MGSELSQRSRSQGQHAQLAIASDQGWVWSRPRPSYWRSIRSPAITSDQGWVWSRDCESVSQQGVRDAGRCRHVRSPAITSDQGWVWSNCEHVARLEGWATDSAIPLSDGSCWSWSSCSTLWRVDATVRVLKSKRGLPRTCPISWTPCDGATSTDWSTTRSPANGRILRSRRQSGAAEWADNYRRPAHISVYSRALAVLVESNYKGFSGPACFKA